MKKQITRLLFLIIPIVLLIIPSCDDTKDNPVEPIRADKVFKTLNFMSASSLDHIMADATYSFANIIILNYISPETIYSGTDEKEYLLSKVITYSDYPSKIENVKVNQVTLDLLVTFLSNIYFLTPENWDNSVLKYGTRANWEIQFKNGDILYDSIDIQKSVHPFKIKDSDTLFISRTNNIIWTPSGKQCDLWMDFTFKATSGTQVEITGKKIEDDGNYIFLPNELKDFGITNDGVLTIRFFRMFKNIKTFIYEDVEKNLVNYSVSETSIKILVKQ